MFPEQCAVFYRMTIRKHHPTNAIGKSRDARFCVSRGSICDYCQAIIEWVYCYGKDGRRNILRLYWAYAIEWMMRSIRMICAACNSRDAKSCVSRGKNAYIASGIIACGYCYGKDGRRKILCLYWARAIEWMMRIKGWYTLATKVETQNLASHEGVYAIIVKHIIEWVYCYGKDGRRNILRLYWARDIEWMMRN